MPAIRVIDRILTSVGLSRTTKEDPPLLSARSAALLSIAFILLYVTPFYFFEKTRPSATVSRDAPSVVKARIRVVTFACIISTLVTALIASKYGNYAPSAVLHLLGYWPVALWDTVKSLALLVILFVGPLFEAAVAEGRWRHWTSPTIVASSLTDLITWRNYVAGPVTEEVLFRSVLIPVHLFAHLSPAKLVFLTPLYFGIAHAHHFYEFRVQHPEYSVSVGVMRTLFQLTYTSLFGFYAAFLFLRTGNIYAAILAHTFCNFMGLPRFWGRVEATFQQSSDTPAARQHPVSSDGPSTTRLHVAWSIAYYALLVAGAYGFYANLWVLTESRYALVKF